MLAHAPSRGGSRQLGPPHPGASRLTLGRLTPAWTVPTLGLTVRPGGSPRGGFPGLPSRSHQHACFCLWALAGAWAHLICLEPGSPAASRLATSSTRWPVGVVERLLSMKMHHGRVACTSKSSIRQEQQAPWTSTWSVNRLRYRPREGAAAAHSIVAQTARRKKCEMISAF